MNRSARMSTADRVLELAVRNGTELDIPAFREAATAIRDEPIPEPTEQPTPDDILYAETELREMSLGCGMVRDRCDAHHFNEYRAMRAPPSIEAQSIFVAST